LSRRTRIRVAVIVLAALGAIVLYSVANSDWHSNFLFGATANQVWQACKGGLMHPGRALCQEARDQVLGDEFFALLAIVLGLVAVVTAVVAFVRGGKKAPATL
jgi:hypothetical protein